MNFKYFFFLLVLGILMSCHSEEKVEIPSVINTKQSSIKLEKILPSHSGITFSNTIKENSRLHAFVWNFIYQGAGVAIGDINNDGLPDIYFSGNMVSDKLYLNKGNFQFEDISKSSGIQDKLWSTGVTMVDINNDGFLDIYVCKNFFLLQKNVRSNKLFTNNGDLTFSEESQDYGLNDPGYSIQSNFFDADNDGDLDMYLVNQPMDQYARQLARPETVKKLPFSDKFFLNENGKYQDITKETNFVNYSYGLSAISSDFDEDGKIDLYLCNDYDNGDKFYFNKGNLDFKNEISERIDHSSYYSMGSDVADINNDGLLDFMTLDMAFSSHYRSKTNMKSMQPEKFWSLVEEGNYYQYPVNNLHVNNGDGHFSEVAHFLNLSHTDWSWSPLFVDLDSDKHNDLIVSNGLLRDLRNNDFINQNVASGNFTVNSSNYQEVLSKVPSTPVSNFLYKNNGGLKFSNESKSSGFNEKGFATGMAYGDLDQDGDMDVVINNTNTIASIFKNNSPLKNYLNVSLIGAVKNLNAIGATVEIFANNHHQITSVNNCRGYMSSSEMISHFGLGENSTIDSLIIKWNENEYSKIVNPKINQTLTIDYKNLTIEKRTKTKNTKSNTDVLNINYVHQENIHDDYATQVLLPHKISQNGPFMSSGDLNGDNLDDIFIGGSVGQSAKIFSQNKQGQFEFKKQEAFVKNKNSEDLGSIFFDLENDGDLDIYVVSGGSQFDQSTKNNTDKIYVNNGQGHFSNYTKDLSFTNFDGQSVVASDFNKDGFVDLFIGGRSVLNKYPQNASSRILINNAGTLVDQTNTWCKNLDNIGMVTDATAKDFDNDGDIDLLVVGEWMAPQILINEGSHFINQELISSQNLTGWHWCVDSADFDNDGDFDIVIGNLGLNNKFKASEEKPFQVFSGDLDGNGDHDVVLAKSNKDKLIPVRGKECSTQEMPFISEKFKTYDAFAKASLVDIYTAEKLSRAFNKSIEKFEHLYLENKGNNKFITHHLPHLTQIGVIKDFIINDFNKDGKLDFLYAGNHFPTEVETVRYDATKGGICLGDGNGGFLSISTLDQSIYLRGDVRDLESIIVNQKEYILATVNNGHLISQKLPSIPSKRSLPLRK